MDQARGVSERKDGGSQHFEKEDLAEDSPNFNFFGEGDGSVSRHTNTSLDNKVRRMEILKSYIGILESDQGNSFERLAILASRSLRCPMSLITIADVDKQYVISSRGVDASGGTLQSPFCSYIITATDCDLLVVLDAAKDERFAEARDTDLQLAASSTPEISFYAGAPLVSPEGYKVGTFCVMDSIARPEGLSLDEKQSLMEFSALAMDTLSQLKRKEDLTRRDPAQQIACTAHDLLTPLTGISLSLSLLKDDEKLQGQLTEQQRDIIDTATNCSAVMSKICQQTLEDFRDQDSKKRPRDLKAIAESLIHEEQQSRLPRQSRPEIVKVDQFVRHLNMVMEPYPKKVPLMITVDPSVPHEFVGDEMKIFRSASNYLSNACAATERGSIELKIYTKESNGVGKELVFECADTGSGVDPATYACLFKPVSEISDPLKTKLSDQINVVSTASRTATKYSGLGLYSVATQISSVSGKYGFKLRHDVPSGSVFWFSIPLVLPQQYDNPSGSSSFSFFSPLNSTELSYRSEKITAGMKRPRLAELPLPSSIRSTKSDDSQGKQDIKIYKSSSLRNLSSENIVAIFESKATEGALDLNSLALPTNSSRKRTALVIEDSLVVRKSLARALEKLDFEVLQASNGMEGLKELQSNLFDLVLCDFLMPVMDGLDCVQQYRVWEANNRPYFHQYIVGISAHANQKDIDQGMQVGMDDFRAKPVTYSTLKTLKNGEAFTKASRELDSLEFEIESHKQRKRDHTQEKDPDSNHKVCLVIDGSSVVSKLAELAVENMNWKVVTVHDGSSALGLLKMRNWDAVLVDDGLKNGRCIATFREWEKSHRINRQRNVVLMSSTNSFANRGSNPTTTSVPVPKEFDDAISKPIPLEAMINVIKKAERDSVSNVTDIVVR